MSSEDKVWGPTGRVSDAFGAWQAVVAVGGVAWGALVAVSVSAFSTLSGFMGQGWGVVFLAGLGAASAAALTLAALFYGLAALATGFVRIRSLSAKPTQPPAIGAAAAPSVAADDLARRVAALERELGDAKVLFIEVRKAVEQNGAALAEYGPAVRAAITDAMAAWRKEVDEAKAAVQATAEAVREENAARFEIIRKTAEHALDQAARRHEALEVRLKAEAASADNRIRDKLEASGNFLHVQITKQEEALGSLHARLDGYQNQVFAMLRARDAEKVLRAIDIKETALFRKLWHDGHECYQTGAAWKIDYEDWKALVKKFWNIVRSYSPSVGEPFALTDADYDDPEHMPDPDDKMFSAPDMLRRYQELSIVRDRHIEFKNKAFEFMEDKGKPPPASNPI